MATSPERMAALIEAHLEAEMRGDLDAAVAVYTDDVEHDMVGVPGSPMRGREAARAFYAQFVGNFAAEEVQVIRRHYGDEVCTMEHLVTGRVTGSVLGMRGGGKRIRFRVLSVFEFRDGLISRENVWLDTSAIAQQLA